MRHLALALIALLAGPATPQNPGRTLPLPQNLTTQSNSRPLSATVVGTYVVRNGELTLLVLWRGTRGWFYGREPGGGSGSRSSMGREAGFESLRIGGQTVSVAFDYTAGVATLLGENISLIDTNVVMVDDVDRPGGGRIVGRRRVDPVLPAMTGGPTRANDPAIVTIRRDSALVAFLQCEVPITLPEGTATLDQEARARLLDLMQRSLLNACPEAGAP